MRHYKVRTKLAVGGAGRDALEAWETPDSPEAMVCAIEHRKAVYLAL